MANQNFLCTLHTTSTCPVEVLSLTCNIQGIRSLLPTQTVGFQRSCLLHTKKPPHTKLLRSECSTSASRSQLDFVWSQNPRNLQFAGAEEQGAQHPQRCPSTKIPRKTHGSCHPRSGERLLGVFLHLGQLPGCCKSLEKPGHSIHRGRENSHHFHGSGELSPTKNSISVSKGGEAAALILGLFFFHACLLQEERKH